VRRGWGYQMRKSCIAGNLSIYVELRSLWCPVSSQNLIKTDRDVINVSC
jgi:hypothetical protein